MCRSMELSVLVGIEAGVLTKLGLDERMDVTGWEPATKVEGVNEEEGATLLGGAGLEEEERVTLEGWRVRID